MSRYNDLLTGISSATGEGSGYEFVNDEKRIRLPLSAMKKVENRNQLIMKSYYYLWKTYFQKIKR